MSTAPLLLSTASGPTLEAMGYKQLQWPGHGVGDNQPFQYLDREYMKADEYDDFLFDPTGYYLHNYLPRVASAFEGFEELPIFPGLHYFRLVAGIRALRQAARCASRSRRSSRRPRRPSASCSTTWRSPTRMTAARLPADQRLGRGLALRLHRRLLPRRHAA